MNVGCAVQRPILPLVLQQTLRNLRFWYSETNAKKMRDGTFFHVHDILFLRNTKVLRQCACFTERVNVNWVLESSSLLF